MTKEDLAKHEVDVQRKKFEHSGRLHAVHWLIIGLSILLTFTAWYSTKNEHDQKIQERFQGYSSQVIELVIERIQLYERGLVGAAAFIDATDTEIDNLLWYEYYKSLRIEKLYPGINGIGVIYNIKPNQLEGYLARQRINRQDYSIYPKHDRLEYWPITYIEPQNINAKAVGLDMAFEENRYAGILKARDTGDSQLTGPIVLVQDSKKTPGFLFYTPFYKKGSERDTVESRRSSVVGVTYAPVIMRNLISGTLASDKRNVSIRISDSDVLLYEDTRNNNQIDLNPLFKSVKEVKLYGRLWRFDIESNAAFRESATSNQSTIILVGGIILDMLIVGLFFFFSRANRQAVLFADQVTAELQVERESLQHSNEDLKQFAYVASHDLKSPINAITKISDWISEDCRDLIPETSKEHLALLRNRCDRMNRLLDDLLNYARIGHQDYLSETVNLKTVAIEALSLCDNAANFSLEVDDVDLYVPRIPFEMVLRNLISNAIKHHDKGKGEVKIRYQKQAENFQISVSDDGPGIAPELFDKAFEIFQTLQPRDQVEGSGMGLPMARRVLAHYDGELKVESDGVRGTKMIISFPY